MNDPTTIWLRSAARDVQTIAQIHGWPLPDETSAALEMAKAAKQVALGAGTTSAPTPHPTKPAGIAKWVTTEAARRLTMGAEAEVAKQLAEDLDRAALRLTLECARSVADHIVRHFPATAEQFTTSAPIAPAEVTGNTTPEEFSAFAAAAQAATALTLAATHRARLAEVLREESVVQAPLWLVLAPTGDTSLFAVTALVKELASQVPNTVDQWSQAFAIGVKLAAPGEADQRIAMYSQALHASGMSHSGGMRDMTFTEALGSEFAAGALIAGQPGERADW